MKLWKDNYRRGQYRKKKKPHFESVKIPKTPPQLLSGLNSNMKLWKDNYRRGQYRKKKKPQFESVKIPKTPPQLRKASSPATRPSLVLQDARLSVRRNIWDESGRGLPVSDTLVFRARSLTHAPISCRLACHQASYLPASGETLVLKRWP